MGSKPNNWRGKREEGTEAHSRKAGRGKFWKDLTNRKRRRWNNRYNFWIVNGSVAESIDKHRYAVRKPGG